MFRPLAQSHWQVWEGLTSPEAQGTDRALVLWAGAPTVSDVNSKGLGEAPGEQDG